MNKLITLGSFFKRRDSGLTACLRKTRTCGTLYITHTIHRTPSADTLKIKTCRDSVSGSTWTRLIKTAIQRGGDSLGHGRLQRLRLATGLKHGDTNLRTGRLNPHGISMTDTTVYNRFVSWRRSLLALAERTTPA
jgi:hypothetical protein